MLHGLAFKQENNNTISPVYLSSRRKILYNVAGNVINIQTGEWVGQMSGLGAGLDSYYEYLLKVRKIFRVYIMPVTKRYILAACFFLFFTFIFYFFF